MPSHEPRDYALVVGINDYPRFGQNGRDLKGAIGDARRFAAWLTDTDSGGGLPQDNCKLVTSEGDPLAMSKLALDNALEDIWNRAEAAGGGRRLYLFFSGHGQLVDGQGSFAYQQSLCLPNWSMKRPNEAILTDSYCLSAQHCMPFTEVIAFLDCCRVPTVRVRGDNTSVFCNAPQSGHEQIRRLTFFAAEPMTRAFEGDASAEEESDTEIVHGHFTSALISGLKKGSDRPGGGITAAALWEHLEYWVPEIAKDAGHRQNPRSDPLDPPDSIVFGTATPDPQSDVAADDAQANIEIRFSDWRDGPFELLNAEADVVRSGPKDSGPWHLHLDHELHVIKDASTEEKMSFHFRAAMEGAHVIF